MTAWWSVQSWSWWQRKNQKRESINRRYSQVAKSQHTLSRGSWTAKWSEILSTSAQLHDKEQLTSSTFTGSHIVFGCVHSYVYCIVIRGSTVADAGAVEMFCVTVDWRVVSESCECALRVLKLKRRRSNFVGNTCNGRRVVAEKQKSRLSSKCWTSFQKEIPFLEIPEFSYDIHWR